MSKRSGEKRDFMQVAREVVEQAIGERMDGTPLEKPVDQRKSSMLWPWARLAANGRCGQGEIPHCREA